jgi:hypothetical protein
VLVRHRICFALNQSKRECHLDQSDEGADGRRRDTSQHKDREKRRLMEDGVHDRVDEAMLDDDRERYRHEGGEDDRPDQVQ